MKKVCVFLLAACCLFGLAGCSCDHEWAPATCTAPKTCTICGEAEGDVLGHVWVDATCTTVKTCSRCGRTSGDPLGHSWIEADCENPKTCTACGTQVGSALGHVWEEATTDAPKTCTVCGAEEGERILTDARFTTDSTRDLWGRWEAAVSLSEKDLDAYHYNGTLEGTFWMEFDNAGGVSTGFVLADEETFRAAMAECSADFVYDQAAEDGADQEEADAVARALHGMDVEEYLLEQQKDIPAEELIEQLLTESDYGGGWIGSFVYCIQDGKLYIDTEWKDDLREITWEQIGTTILLENFLELKKADGV